MAKNNQNHGLLELRQALEVLSLIPFTVQMRKQPKEVSSYPVLPDLDPGRRLSPVGQPVMIRLDQMYVFKQFRQLLNFSEGQTENLLNPNGQ